MNFTLVLLFTNCIYSKVFPKCVKGMQDVDNEEFDVDCRVLLTEWTHLNGIPLSELAIKIFMLRMLSVDSSVNNYYLLIWVFGKTLEFLVIVKYFLQFFRPQDLTGTYFSRFSSICLETIKTFATKFQGFKEAEHELLVGSLVSDIYLSLCSGGFRN